MIPAYSKLYLTDARKQLANSLDYAVHTLNLDLTQYYNTFVNSDICARFEKGDPFLVSGKSGIELALMVAARDNAKIKPMKRVYHDGKTPEYWAGWAIAYYQWYNACSLRILDQEVPIAKILKMYDKYHEMDISHFVTRIDEMRQAARCMTYLKKYRELRGYSQSELAELSGIPLKTLQHYEQGDKSLAKANAAYVITLARLLDCAPEILIG
ncbi:MAG: helix-turn-helix transcriptional regulator [Lachnospiraceae bacterium]|nr:helix-turn-helix transcriptional regulator [Lachnospiraceae bacterium]